VTASCCAVADACSAEVEPGTMELMAALDSAQISSACWMNEERLRGPDVVVVLEATVAIELVSVPLPHPATTAVAAKVPATARVPAVARIPDLR
jgi:hypothetical protein